MGLWSEQYILTTHNKHCFRGELVAIYMSWTSSPCLTSVHCPWLCTETSSLSGKSFPLSLPLSLGNPAPSFKVQLRCILLSEASPDFMLLIPNRCDLSWGYGMGLGHQFWGAGECWGHWEKTTRLEVEGGLWVLHLDLCIWVKITRRM